MKVKLVGKTVADLGFSTLEMIIALALMSLVISSSLQTIYMSQYFILGGEISSEGLYITKNLLETARNQSSVNFYTTSSTPLYTIKPESTSGTTSCLSSFCYQAQLIVDDISTCSKSISAATSWRLSPRYSTSSVVLESLAIHKNEVIDLGGDCLLTKPRGDWLHSPLNAVSRTTRAPQLSSGIDVLGKYIYQTASSAPQLTIYQQSSSGISNPVIVGTSTGSERRLNEIDVINDLATGRRYAYVTQHSSSSQLGVIDVTDPANPIWLTDKSLLGVDSNGSFPQGWRLMAYGNRLYVLTRETAGAELHIFDISKPYEPTELPSGIYNLNRTVNDLVVREQLVGGIMRRFIVMVASSNLKELGIFEVTYDIPIELVSVDLPGTEDALSVSLLGNRLYLGRRATSAGPELYQFELLDLLLSSTPTPLAVSEVGADIATIRSSGSLLYLGTNRSGAEFQVWHSSTDLWDVANANTARISFQSITKLAPLGIEMSTDFIYTHTQSSTQAEEMVVMSTL